MDTLSAYNEALGDANVFGSSYLIPEGGVLKPEDFPNLNCKVNYLRNFINVQQKNFLTCQELHNKFPDCPLPEVEALIERVSSIITRLNIKLEKLDLTMPFMPLIVKLINISEKGCAK